MIRFRRKTGTAEMMRCLLLPFKHLGPILLQAGFGGATGDFNLLIYIQAPR